MINGFSANKDPLDGAVGAFVQAIALADNSNDYRRIVRKHLKDLNLNVKEWKAIETYKERVLKAEPHKEIVELDKIVNSSNPVVFDEFQAYFNE